MEDDMIPKARLDAVLAKLADAEKQIATLNTSLEAKTAETRRAVERFEKVHEEFAQAKTAHAEALAKIEADHAIDRTLTSAGITDPEMIDYLRFKHGNAEPVATEEGADPTKPDFSAWFESYKAANPPVLAAYLKPAETPKEPAAPPPRNGAVKAPAPPPPSKFQTPGERPAQEVTTAPPEWTPQQIARMPAAERRAALAAHGLRTPSE